MVAGGIGSNNWNITTTEIYDPEINSWYVSKDLPHTGYNDYNQFGRLINWNGSPLWIDRGNISKFVDGEWILLESTPTILDNQKFAITLPDDFIPDC